MNKYVKKTVQGLLLGIGLIWGLFLFMLFVFSGLFDFPPCEEYAVDRFISFFLFAIWIGGLCVWARGYYKKGLLLLVILCVLWVPLAISGRWYWDKCPSDKPLRIEKVFHRRCYSCVDPEAIYLGDRPSLKQKLKQIEICPNRDIVSVDGAVYSVVEDEGWWSEEAESHVSVGVSIRDLMVFSRRVGWYSCEESYDIRRLINVMGYCTLLSLTLIWGVLFWRKKKND